MSSDARRRYGLVLRMLRGIVMLCVLAMSSLALAFPSEEMPSFVLSLPFFQFVPAMLSLSAILVCGFLLSALVFGRVYCSFWCPLGIVQDLVRAVARLFNVVPLKIRPSVRYGLAAAGGALALLGAAWLFDPYGIFSRALVLLTIPHVQVPVAVGMWGLLCIAGISAMTVFRARWWCNQVCPVGTILGLLSRFALVRPRIDRSKCVNCNVCVGRCEAGCIPAGKGKRIDCSKCVVCFRCVGTCGKGAISWR